MEEKGAAEVNSELFLSSDSLHCVPLRSCRREFEVTEVNFSAREILFFCDVYLLDLNYILIDLFNFAYVNCELVFHE